MPLYLRKIFGEFFFNARINVDRRDLRFVNILLLQIKAVRHMHHVNYLGYLGYYESNLMREEENVHGEE